MPARASSGPQYDRIRPLGSARISGVVASGTKAEVGNEAVIQAPASRWPGVYITAFAIGSPSRVTLGCVVACPERALPSLVRRPARAEAGNATARPLPVHDPPARRAGGIGLAFVGWKPVTVTELLRALQWRGLAEMGPLWPSPRWSRPCASSWRIRTPSLVSQFLGRASEWIGPRRVLDSNESGPVTCDGSRCGMIRPVCLHRDRQRPVQRFPRRELVAHVLEHAGQIIGIAGDAGMVAAERRLVDRQGALERRTGTIEVAKIV